MLNELKEQLSQAMRARDEVTVRTLRMLSAAITNARIANGAELSTEAELAVVKKEVKMHRDSIESYRAAKREDLAKNEEAELAVLLQFLPSAPSHDEIAAAVTSAISSSGAHSVTNMGQVIGLAIKELGAGADGSLVAQEAKRQLTSS